MPPQRLPGVPTDYYAPNFKVEVEGQELHPESKSDILEIKVVLDSRDMCSFQLSINNWDAAHFRFKYSDTRRFDVGNRVQVQMGYGDRLVSMIQGQIMSLTPRFPESGYPTLAISGQGGMVSLHESRPDEKHPIKYIDKTDWEIAQVVAQRHDLGLKVTKEGDKHPLVIQKNQDDAQFLMERAKRIDFECFVVTDPDTSKETLHFTKPSDGRDSEDIRLFELKWGESLMNFNPHLTISNQVGTVTVRGWSPATKLPISYTATANDLPFEIRTQGTKGTRGTNGPEAVNRSLKRRSDVIIDAPVSSDQEAKRLAISLLRERAYKYITGSGQIIGLPDLRPGDNLSLQGLGTRFSGNYHVLKAEHTLGSSGYLTSFEVRKPFDGEVSTDDTTSTNNR